jgi:hypothetical protein
MILDQLFTQPLFEDIADPNRLIVSVTIQPMSTGGEPIKKEIDLTGQFQGNTRSQMEQAMDYLTKMLESKGLNFTTLQARYQGSIMNQNNQGTMAPQSDWEREAEAKAAQMRAQARAQRPVQNATPALKEFAPSDDSGGPDQEEILRRLAAHWWNGNEHQMARSEHTLAAMGWEIGEDDGYDDGGVFVVRPGDEHGRSYLSWPHEELEMNEAAPPGAKAERMVKHIKAGYAQDGKLTPKEKGIAFATAWKAHNAGRVEEGEITKNATGLKHRATDKYGAGDDEPHHYTGGRSGFSEPGKYARDLEHVNKQLVKDLDASMGISWKNRGPKGLEVDEQGVAEGLTEMDKSEPSAGRDTGPRPGPDREAKPISAKKATKDMSDMLNRAVKDSHKKKDVKESDTLMLKLQRALIKEGRVKELADDLKTMNDADFMKKYGKVKAAIRKDMKRVDEAAQTNYTPQEMADILSGKKTQQQVDAERAKKIDDQTDDLVMRVDKQGRRVDKNGKLLPPPKTWTNPPINPPPGKMQQYEGLDEQDTAGQQFVGTGTSSNWQMSVDIAAMNARKKAAQSIAGTNSFQGVQLPPGTKYGPQDTKSDGTGKYVSTYTITLPAPSQSAEPAPAAPGAALDSSPATSNMNGSMSTGAPAAVGPAAGNYMKVNELSTNKLSQYKTAAAKDAKKADQAGDFKRGDKRLGGMVQATKKQFDNDAKKVDESRAARRALMARIVNAR